MAILEAQGVHKAYRLGRATVPVLQGVDLAINKGDFVAIMGPSGCGKTTLLNCLSGLDTVDQGRILLEGNDLGRMSDRKRTRHRGDRIGFVFQAFHLIPVLSAIQNVQLPLELKGMRRSEARGRAEAALAAVGIPEQASKRPVEMSGGQQQRVAIARALVNDPAVVFADEPTGNLDSKTGADVLDVFRMLNKEHDVTFVVVTHDERVAKQASRVVRMDSGLVAQDRRA